MSSSHSKALFSQYKVTPDVLSTDADIKYDLTVSWPETTLSKPGEELDREQTQTDPTLKLSPAPEKPLQNLVIIMTDPDMMMNNDTYFGQIRHWFVTNASTTPDGTVTTSTGATISPYVGPAPLPNYLYSRPHRYVFIVASSPSPVQFSPADFENLQRPYVAALHGKQEVQDLKDRWGFNAQKLIEEKGLRVEAASFMRVGGSLKSAVANAGMMAQAVVDKVVGK